MLENEFGDRSHDAFAVGTGNEKDGGVVHWPMAKDNCIGFLAGRSVLAGYSLAPLVVELLD
jgi:hypothetical protein